MDSLIVFNDQVPGSIKGDPIKMKTPKMKRKYSFDGKAFAQITTLMNESKNLGDSAMSVLNMMLGDIKMRTTVRLSVEMTKASDDQLISGMDKKVVYEYLLSKSFIGDHSTDFGIKIK
ncbi:MAG: hypothetical protein AAF551_07785 [Bacteroidota bacterium]